MGTRLIGLFCLGMLACHGVPHGDETLATLRKANDDFDGWKKHQDCGNGDHDACKWVSAFWKADLADAEARCAQGHAGRCADAAEYYQGTRYYQAYLGASVVHIAPDHARVARYTELACLNDSSISGDPKYTATKEFFNGSDDPRGMRLQLHGVSTLGVPPVEDARFTMPDDSYGYYCQEAGRMFAEALYVAPDLAKAEAYLRRACKQREFPACIEVDDPASAYQGWRQEAPDARAARVDAYWAKRHDEIRSNTAEGESIRTENRAYEQQARAGRWQAAATGFQAGMATHNAVNGSLATAQHNIDVTLANPKAKTPVAPVPSPGPPNALPPVGSPGGGTGGGPGGGAGNGSNAMTPGQRNQAALAACLAEVVPAMHVAQTNPFPSLIAQYGGLVDTASRTCTTHQTWRTCMGSNAVLWPDRDASYAFDDYFRRALLVGLPGCAKTVTLGEVRSQCLFVGRDSCLDLLANARAELECASGNMSALFVEEDKRNNADARQRHDDACRARYK